MLGRASSAGRSNKRLAVRRRNRRRTLVLGLIVFLFALLGSLIWGSGRSAVRITEVTVENADASLKSYAENAMQGKYFGIIPRDSIFFFPEKQIRLAIRSDYPDIATISIARTSFTSIKLSIIKRVPVARWCGLMPSVGEEEEYCYVFDADGYLFAARDQASEPINKFRLYAPLVENTLEPLRASIVHVENLPALFDFARELSTFGSPTAHVVIRGDEADVYLLSGTRVTYVLGTEQNAFAALISARENTDLVSGAVEYVDLRFDAKVYLKRR